MIPTTIAALALMLAPPQPSADMQQFIDRGLINGNEAGQWSPLLWDALRRHDIPPLWERPQYCGRTPYEALARVLWIESRWDPHAVGVNGDGSLDRGLAQINDRVPPEPATDAQAFDPRWSIDYLVRHAKAGRLNHWHAWGKYLKGRWC